MTHFLHYLNRFTKTWCAALAGMMLMAVPAAHASFSVDVHPSGSIPDLPDPAGRAGMIAGTRGGKRRLPVHYRRGRGQFSPMPPRGRHPGVPVFFL